MSRDLTTAQETAPEAEDKTRRASHAFDTDRPAGAAHGGGPKLPYSPGLDGMRALAVIAVLLYHAGLTWLPGGFLGVEVFFVISGYLITALLLAERRDRGRINLKQFWYRRARRLLPALFLVLVVTLAFAVMFLPREVAGLRGDAIAAFGYVTNWYLIFVNDSYFEAVGRPSLLKHLWSLAIEEQFYLIWPLVLAFAIARWPRRYALLTVIAVAVASAALMGYLFQPGMDPSRIYYGTDTRAAGLLFGAALAFAWSPGRRTAELRRFRNRRDHRLARMNRRWRWTLPLLLDFVGLLALGGLVWACLSFDESQAFVYRGGLPLVALATVVLIFVVVHPRARLGKGLLGRQPLRWIGLRSYGIYLWHWPVFMVTRPDLDVRLDGLPLLALRLMATLALADLSYRYVEVPVRSGAIGRAWKALRESHGLKRWGLGAGWVASVGASVAFCVVLGISVVNAKAPPPPDYLASMKAVHTKAPADAPADVPEAYDVKPPSEEAPKSEPPRAEAEKPPAEESASEKREEEAPVDSARAVEGTVTAIGDSVMLGSIAQLDKAVGDLPVVDAEVGMQAAAAIDILKWRRDSGQLGDTVIVHLGNNGTFTEEQFDEMMRVLGGRKVIFVNLKVPRTWEASNNEVLADGVRRHPENATLVDWQSASASHPEYFWDDGMHLRPEGAKVYAKLITSNLK